MGHVYRTAAAHGTGETPDAAGIDEIRRMVAEIVRHLRPMGIRRALLVAAEILGIGERRCRGYYHGEIRCVPDGELETVRGFYAVHLRQRRAELAAEAAAVDAYLAERAA